MREKKSESFVKLPRELLENPLWMDLRMTYQKVFLTILQHCCYQDRDFSINHNLVRIKKGQLCASIRGIVDLCNKGVRFKEDLIDKNIVERSVSLFIQLQLVRQEVRHGKTVLSILLPGYYEQEENETETGSETKVRQNRDTNEEREEREEYKAESGWDEK